MEDSSFFRDQAKRCRHQAVGADLTLQITLETFAIDCIAYADELDYKDDYWFANRHRVGVTDGAEVVGDAKDCWNIANNDAWHIRAGGVDAIRKPALTERCSQPLFVRL
jgi:hypothetical protein